MSFKKFADVKEHERTHAERERPFKSTQCESAFMTAKNLKQHTFTHSEETPFKCTLCGKGFRQAAMLRNHNKSAQP